jgi:hypothetical protein
MYVGVLAVILGWAVLFQSTAILRYGFGVALCCHLFVVLGKSRIFVGRSAWNMRITALGWAAGCRSDSARAATCREKSHILTDM